MADIPEGPPTSWGWVGFVVPVVVALGVIWGLVKGYFELVTRTELKDALAEMQAAHNARYAEMQRSRDKQHEENTEVLRDIADRMGEVEKSVSHIEGELSGSRRGISG